MQFSILGPLEVIGDTGRPVEVRDEERNLLALLLLTPNQVVPAPRLIQELWGDSLPEWARGNLHMRIARLRRALRAGGADREILQADDLGCLLHVPADSVDGVVFEDLMGEAARLSAADEREAAAALLERALSLWRGPAFADVSGPPSLAYKAEELERARQAALDALAATAGGSGAAFGTAPADLSPRVALPSRLAAQPRSGFHGRSSEQEILSRRLDDVAGGHRRVVFISGEPGIGKTSLAAEVARDGFRLGATVLYGRCDEEMGGGYQPFPDALRPYVIEGPADLLAAHVDRCGGDLVRVIPELAQRIRDLPAPVQTEPDGERLRLFDAVVDLLSAATQRTPVVLVIDDLQWAARPALLLLRHLIRATRPLALLVLGIFRDTELGHGHPLTELLGDVRSEEGVERLALAGLTEPDLIDLLNDVAGANDERAGVESFAHRLWEDTDGNPFFVNEVLHDLAETSSPGRDLATWLAGREKDDLVLPESVRDVIRGRLARLSPAANRVLSAAAVCGRDFELGVLERMAEVVEDPVTLLDGLDEAIAAHLVAEMPDAVGRYTFAHALVRQTLYGELSAARRARLHERAGEALEAYHGNDLAEHLATLVHHFAEAAPVAGAGKAADYALRAARQAIDGLSFEDAEVQAERGLAVLNSTEAADDERRLELWLVLAHARAVLLDRAGSKAAALAAAEAARRLGRAEGLARAARTAVSGMAGGMANTPDVEVVALCEEALARLEPSEIRLRAQVLAVLSEHRALYAQGAGSEPLAREALAAARRAGDTETTCLALGALYWALEGSDRVDELRSITDEVIDIAGGSDNLVHRANGYFWRACVRITLGDRDGFDSDVAVLDGLAERSRSVLAAVRATLCRTSQALLDGRFDEVEPLAEKMLTVGDPTYVQAYFGQLFFLRREQGRLEEFKAAFLAMVDQGIDRPVFITALAWMHAELGELEEARARAEPVLADGLASVPHDSTWAVSLAVLSEVTARLEDGTASTLLYDRLLPYKGLFVHPSGATILGAADRYLGMLAAAAGRRTEAVAHFEAALRLEAGVRSSPLLARTRYWYARLLIASPDERSRARGQKMAEVAIDTAAPLGMERIVADSRALLH